MKILVGFCMDDHPTQWEYYKKVFGTLGDEVRVFGNLGGDVVYQSGMTIQDILKKLPDFYPDLVVLYDIEYWLLPQNLEQFDGITVALVGDWNLNSHGVLASYAAIDYNFTDKAGVEFLKKWGIQAEYFPMFFHNPEIMRPNPSAAKDYDLVFAGNLSGEIQGERNRWLYRLARLSRKYKIGIFTSVFGEEYANILRRGKIVFNRSIRQEMNMRAFEAAACGSLLFYDEENLEVRDFFQDRVHCVLYNEKNLEELIEYYLTHEEEREKIAQAGLQKVQEFEYSNRIKKLLKRFHELPKGIKHRKKIFKEPNLQIYLSQLYTPGSPFYLGEPPQNDCQINNQYSLIVSVILQKKEDLERLKQIGESLKNLAYKNPNNLILHFNAGWCLMESNQQDEALAFFIKACSLAKSGSLPDENYIPILPRWSYFFVHWHQTFWKGPDKVLEKQRNLLYQQLCLFIGTIFEWKNELKKAEAFYRDGLSLNPENHLLLKSFGELLETKGDLRESSKFLIKAHELNPHDFSTTLKIIRVLGQFDREKAEEFLDENLELFSAFPQSEPLKEKLKKTYVDLIFKQEEPNKQRAAAQRRKMADGSN